MMRTFGLAALLLFAATAAPAQSRDERCDGYSRDRASHCEVREETIAGGNPLDIDAGPNGGIRIRGWNGPGVQIRAKVQAFADTTDEARQLVAQVQVDTGGGQVRARGPRSDGDRHWSVSYEVDVPQNSQLTLNTVNGGISVRDLRGTVTFRARNGGVTLENVGGDIRGETSNGGLNIDLTGSRWDGAGLDVETSNGGVKLNLPADYSAELETETTNGRVKIDFPVTVQGLIGRRVHTTLGAGGPKIRVITTNGGVDIRRR